MDIKSFIENREQYKVLKKFPKTFYYISEYPNLSVYQQLLFMSQEIASLHRRQAEFLTSHQQIVKSSVFDSIEQLEKKLSVIRQQVSFMSRKVLEPDTRYGQSQISMIDIQRGDFNGMVYSETDNGIIFENAINTYNVKVTAKDVMEKYRLYRLDSKFQIKVL